MGCCFPQARPKKGVGGHGKGSEAGGRRSGGAFGIQDSGFGRTAVADPCNSAKTAENVEESQEAQESHDERSANQQLRGGLLTASPTATEGLPKPGTRETCGPARWQGQTLPEQRVGQAFQRDDALPKEAENAENRSKSPKSTKDSQNP